MPRTLRESRSHWIQIIEDTGGDIFSDFWTTQAMLRLDIGLAKAELEAGKTVAAEASIDRAVTLARQAMNAWPDQSSIRDMYDEARKLRSQILDQH